MKAPSTIRSEATGRTWTVQMLTAAQSRAYRRKGEPAAKLAAHSPGGSIIRAATVEALERAVNLSNSQ